MLTYGEFLRRQSEPAFSNFAFGDMYAFGAPRCCLQPFASEVNRRTASPQGGKFAFRIVNMLDPVPTMPPSKKEQLVEYPFVHPGHAWRTRTTEGPDKMDDEPPPVEPQRKQDILANWHHHGSSILLLLRFRPCVFASDADDDSVCCSTLGVLFWLADDASLLREKPVEPTMAHSCTHVVISPQVAVFSWFSG